MKAYKSCAKGQTPFSLRVVLLLVFILFKFSSFKHLIIKQQFRLTKGTWRWRCLSIPFHVRIIAMLSLARVPIMLPCCLGKWARILRGFAPMSDPMRHAFAGRWSFIIVLCMQLICLVENPVMFFFFSLLGLIIVFNLIDF